MADAIDSESRNRSGDDRSERLGENSLQPSNPDGVPEGTAELRPSPSGQLSASEENLPVQVVNPLLAFLAGHAGPRGLLHSQILDMSDDELEKSHDLVQWLFPLNEPSQYNADAPILTDEDLPQISLLMRANMLSGVLRFLTFFGMDYIAQGPIFIVSPADNFQTRSEIWATPNNHNLKRITRIIRSCRFFKADKVAFGIHYAFVSMQEQMPHVITDTVKSYWDDAMNLPLEMLINSTGTTHP